MFEQKTTVPAEAAKIMEMEESHYLDLKAVEIKPSKLSETISAFANTSGGEIFVGIGEKKQGDGSRARYWSGFPNMERPMHTSKYWMPWARLAIITEPRFKRSGSRG
jgi:ATP-dependent DNA helicase RecG